MPINVMLAPMAAAAGRLGRAPHRHQCKRRRAAAGADAYGDTDAAAGDAAHADRRRSTRPASRKPAAISTPIAALALDSSRYRGADIRRQMPYAGLVERTVSVAERLKPRPPSRRSNMRSPPRRRSLATLSGLEQRRRARPASLWTTSRCPASTRRRGPGRPSSRRLAQLLEDRAPDQDRRFMDADELPGRDKHESDYFTATVEGDRQQHRAHAPGRGRVDAVRGAGPAAFSDLRDDIQRSAPTAPPPISARSTSRWRRRATTSAPPSGFGPRSAARVDATNARRASGARQSCPGDRLAPGARVRPSHAWRRRSRSLSGLAADPVAACRREHEECPTRSRIMSSCFATRRCTGSRGSPRRSAGSSGSRRRAPRSRRCASAPALPLFVAAPRTVAGAQVPARRPQCARRPAPAGRATARSRSRR